MAEFARDAIIHLEHIEESDVEDDEALEERDDDEEGRVEHGQPADGLGVDDVEDVLGDVEGDGAEGAAEEGAAGAAAQQPHPREVNEHDESELRNGKAVDPTGSVPEIQLISQFQNNRVHFWIVS